MHLRVGIVGVGFGQRVLVPAFRADPRCEVVALCASTLQHAQTVAHRLRIPKAYGDWRVLVADREVEALAIATPPCLQPTIALGALARGKPLFCEKPLATTPQAAAAMVNAARKAGVAHMVDFEFPALEQWQRAKEIVQQGILGRIRHVLVTWQVETYAVRERIDSWKLDPQRGGGVLNAFVSHSFYYLEWLLGPIQSLHARLFPQVETLGGASPGETLAVMCLVLRDGTPVSMTVTSHAFLGGGHRVEIYADQGTLVLENPSADYAQGFTLRYGMRAANRLEAVSADRHQTTTPQGTGCQHGEERDGRITAVGRLVERFADWIEQGIPAHPTFEDGFRVQCLLGAARQSDGARGWVDCPQQRGALSSMETGHLASSA